MRTPEQRQVDQLRLDLLAASIRDLRATGRRLDVTAAIAMLTPLQAEVMTRALEHLAAGRRRPNLSRIARELGLHHNTVREAYNAASINVGAALTGQVQ